MILFKRCLDTQHIMCVPLGLPVCEYDWEILYEIIEVINASRVELRTVQRNARIMEHYINKKVKENV